MNGKIQQKRKKINERKKVNGLRKQNLYIYLKIVSKMYHKIKKALFLGHFSLMVEAMGFEPMTSWSRTKRATKLHHASIYKLCYSSIECFEIQEKEVEKAEPDSDSALVTD